MPDFFQKAKCAFDDGTSYCAPPLYYEKEFKRNDKGVLEYIGSYDSSKLEKKELKVSVGINSVVYCVLFFDKEKYKSIKKISQNICNVEPDVSQVCRQLSCESIVEATYKNIKQLIESLASEKGRIFSEKISPEEISRAVGRDFLSFIAMMSVRAPGEPKSVVNALHFFEKISQVALEKYEKKDLFGSILLASPNNESISIVYRFKENISFDNLRLLRKVLELTNETYCLLFDGFFYGVGKINDREIQPDNDVYVIKFEGLGLWNLCRKSNNDKLLIVKNGIPSIPMPKISQKQIEQKYEEVFGDKSTEKFEKLYSSILALINQNKGGIFLISDAAKDESERLKSQAMLLEPFPVDENNISKLTSIDGAILVDECGVCYAIGVIFDGEIPQSGGCPSRGSRYNSSVRYTNILKSHGKKVMTIVISDDGMVDIL